MKEYFIYMISKHESISNKLMHTFCNNLLIAIDTTNLDEDFRKNLQLKLNILPFYISQKIFISLLEFLRLSNNFITDIKFSDLDTNSEEYGEIIDLILEQDKQVFNTINNYAQDFQIEFLSFRYKGFIFKLTSQAVLYTEANNTVLSAFFNDNDLNNIFMS